MYFLRMCSIEPRKISKLLRSEGRSGVLVAATSVALLGEGRCVVRGAAICSSLLGEGRLLGAGIECRCLHAVRFLVRGFLLCEMLQHDVLQHSIHCWGGSWC